MAINRRQFIGALSALGLIGVVPGAGAAAQTKTAGFITTARNRLTQSYLLARLDENLDVVWEAPLPARAHDLTVAPDRHRALVVARRPGYFVRIFDLATGKTDITIEPAAGRHFYGHGVFSGDGQTLFTTENVFATGDGVVGVYDVADGGKRLGEFTSGGVGPHELALAGDGRTLVVANGGIRTHPDRGRDKLNLDTMRSSVVTISISDGTIRETASIADPAAQFLSIRHFALTKSCGVFACQNQRTEVKGPPLVYAWDFAGDATLRPLAMPEDVRDAFQGYCGSAAFDPGSGTVAVTGPRGGIVGIWKNDAGFGWLGRASLVDGCGVDGNAGGTGYLLTSGNGDVRLVDADGHTRHAKRHPFRQWDNHLTALPIA